MHNEAIKMAKWAMADACAKGYDKMNHQDWDDFKDCVETAKNAIECDYYYRLVECMKKDEEEEKREDAYFLDMLKEEYKDDYKRMKDEYGESEETDRRFYDEWRYKTTGRYAPKGKGTRVGRRGYVEPPYYRMMPEMYDDYNAEEMRDIDRQKGRMYFSQPMGNMGTVKADGGNYSDGYNDGQTRGYSEGYEKGMNDGKRNNSSRFDRARRGYEEAKEQHKGNDPESKRLNMQEAEKFMNVILDELEDALEDASPEVKNMVKSKTVSKMQKL